MAKKSMVTRTIKSTQVTALCLNIESAEPFNVTVKLPGVFAKPEKLIDALRESIDNDTEKFVSIVHSELCEDLYGMTEEKFIENAEVLPKRGEKTCGADLFIPVED